MKLTQCFLFSAIVLFLSGITSLDAGATTHYTIEFGGVHGLVYIPNSLNVQVGDTLIWDGAMTAQTFWNHPLESTQLPLGADSVAMDTGTVFTYVVKIAGVYHYQCHYHFASGMTGSFTASPAAVKENPSNVLSAQNYPNPFTAATSIKYELNTSSPVDLKVFDLAGKEIYSLSTFQNQGVQEVHFDGSALPSGSYFYRLQAGEGVLNRQMIIAR
jgi:plastocyanin